MTTSPRARLVLNATVVDGTGAQPQPRDVLVVDDRIVRVSAPGTENRDGHEVLDASGLVVSPGFIDVHSHADNAPFLAADDTSKILQGVTTEVVGNCGFSLAPVAADRLEVMQAYSRRLFPPLPWDWASFGEFLQATDAAGYVTNYAPLVGHHAIRVAVLGMDDRAPTANEQKQMEQLVDEAMADGAFGLSSGLIYPPGLFAATEEVIGLANRLPDGRPYVTHMRNESTGLLDSLHETMAIGVEGSCAVHVSHLKAAGRNNWGTMTQALAVIQRARGDGMTVTQDIYPYTAGSTMLTAALPPWFQEGGNASVLARLENPRDLDRLRANLQVDDGSWENVVMSAGWDGLVVSSTASHEFEGMTLQQIATTRREEPFDALVRVLKQEELQASMVMHMMHEDDLETALADPVTMIGSDGLPPGAGGKPHPRMYGTFPRVLARYARERGSLTMAEAVRRMTSLPAQTFGLHDRGVIAPDMSADLVCFSPDEIADQATYDDPAQSPHGITWVMQNGNLVVHNGAYIGQRGGRRLTPAR